MARKKPQNGGGAPEWVVTYGDMMSLLLTFFILLAALSELKKEDQYQAIVEAIKANFGIQLGGGGRSLEKTYQMLSLIPLLKELEKKQQEPNQSQSPEQGMEGRFEAVTRVREGLQFIIGGRITFEPGSAQLTERAKKNLKVIADRVRGYANIVDIRGHASPMDLAEGSMYPDLWTLSFARAQAVMEYLVREGGLNPRQLRLVAAADTEPLVARRYGVEEQEPNRRVEIVVHETLVQEMRELEKGR